MSVIGDPVPPEGYIQLELLQDSDSLTSTAIEHMEDAFDGWERNPANPDTVMIESAGEIAGELVEQASLMPPEAFARILTTIYNIPMLEGTEATMAATFTFDETAVVGLIDADTWVSVPHPSGDNILFATVDDVAVAPNTVVVANLISDAAGSAPNGAAGASDLIDPVEGLVSIVAEEAAGGTDGELVIDFINRGSTILSTGERRPVLPEDHAVFAAANVPGVGRATALNLLVPGTVDEPTAVRDPNEVNYFATLGGVPTENTWMVPRCTTVAIAPEDPTLSQAGLDALKLAVWTYLDENREINFLNYVIQPTYTVIDVQGDVHPYPGFSGADAVAAATEMLQTWLDPTIYGSTPGVETTKQWINDPVIRHDEAVDFANRGISVWWTRNIQMRIGGDVPGPWVDGDLFLDDLAPLPLAGAITLNAV